jgi:hypothetical protein
MGAPYGLPRHRKVLQQGLAPDEPRVAQGKLVDHHWGVLGEVVGRGGGGVRCMHAPKGGLGRRRHPPPRSEPAAEWRGGCEARTDGKTRPGTGRLGGSACGKDAPSAQGPTGVAGRTHAL